MIRKDCFCGSLPPDVDSPGAGQHDGALLTNLSDTRSGNSWRSPATLLAAILTVVALAACMAQLLMGRHRRHRDDLTVIAFCVTGKAASFPINLCAAESKQR